MSKKLKQTYFIGLAIFSITDDGVSDLLDEMQTLSGASISSYFINRFEHDEQMALAGVVFDNSEERDKFVNCEKSKLLYIEAAKQSEFGALIAQTASANLASSTMQ